MIDLEDDVIVHVDYEEHRLAKKVLEDNDLQSTKTTNNIFT